jgi:shikimate kinase
MKKVKLEQNIFMIGFMGSGKSSVSLQLADMTNAPKAEMDQILVDREGMTIAEIFAQKGEPYFREQETELLKEFGKTGPQIVSCGGGVVMKDVNVEEMKKSGVIVCLTATPDVIYERVKDSRERPILNGNMNVEYIAELMEARRPFYEKATNIMIDTSHMRIDQVAEAVLEAVVQAK